MFFGCYFLILMVVKEKYCRKQSMMKIGVGVESGVLGLVKKRICGSFEEKVEGRKKEGLMIYVRGKLVSTPSYGRCGVDAGSAAGCAHGAAGMHACALIRRWSMRSAHRLGEHGSETGQKSAVR
jgi:hypothetical protein